MDDIEIIYNRDGDVEWAQDEYCSGFEVSSKECRLRYNEMELVSYTPIQC